MATVAFRLAYHRPMPNTERVDRRSYGPIPLFVNRDDYLTSADFVSAQLLEHSGNPVVSIKLTTEGKEKINHLASLNAQAQQLEDYVQLIRVNDGRLTDALTLVNNPIPGDEMSLNQLARDEASFVVDSLGGRVAP